MGWFLSVNIRGSQNIIGLIVLVLRTILSGEACSRKRNYVVGSLEDLVSRNLKIKFAGPGRQPAYFLYPSKESKQRKDVGSGFAVMSVAKELGSTHLAGQDKRRVCVGLHLPAEVERTARRVAVAGTGAASFINAFAFNFAFASAVYPL
jgi:hypothetical protein